MNFFNSIFSDDPEPSDLPSSPRGDLAHNELENPSSENPNPSPESPDSGAPASAWNFGGLISTITTRSESLIGNYRRDFEEFGSGLLKETVLIRDVASRAVQEFPDSIDAGAAVAQEKLESVGEAIDSLGSSVWQGTSNLLARGKELNLFDDNIVDDVNGGSGDQLNDRNINVKRYSWFESRMREIQADPRTYTEEPDDLEDYKRWKSGFKLDEKGEEIEKLTEEERTVERIYLELVPVTIDRESFWSRYFYRVDKLKQAEEARARIVKRAISGDDDEELSWDVDDDEDISNGVPTTKVPAESTTEAEIVEDTAKRSLVHEDAELSGNVSNGEIVEAARSSDASGTNGDVQEQTFSEAEGKVSGKKSDGSDSCKDSDFSVISTQPSLPGEEELGWDEIDDVGSDSEGKVIANSSSNVADLRKRMSAADEEEDLSWDIEDDDEPIKS